MLYSVLFRLYLWQMNSEFNSKGNEDAARYFHIVLPHFRVSWVSFFVTSRPFLHPLGWNIYSPNKFRFTVGPI